MHLREEVSEVGHHGVL